MLFSRSESASSCFMISAFSRFWAFAGSVAHVFATIAPAAMAATTPMHNMLIMDACFLDNDGQAASRCKDKLCLLGSGERRLPTLLSKTFFGGVLVLCPLGSRYSNQCRTVDCEVGTISQLEAIVL
jgi:hypothetical protein